MNGIGERFGFECSTCGAYHVGMPSFARGAALKDPSGLFNSSLDGNTRRAIDFREGEKLDEEALKRLVLAAMALNRSRARS